MSLDVINWMGSVDDSKKLSDLTIPGTHGSAATVATGAGNRLSNQVLDLRAQLNAGVRFLDIRARYIENEFRLSHENFDLDLGFDEARDLFMAFLAEHPRETIIMSLKEEGDATENDPDVTFEQRFDGYVDENRALWYLQNDIPTLGQVRGKIVLFRRFPAESLPKGINAHPFENDTTFVIKGPPTLKIQDWYHVLATDLSKGRKWSTVEALLNEASGSSPIGGALYLNFTSGAGLLPRNTPRAVADYINPPLRDYFKNSGPDPRRFGIVAMDFAEVDLIARIVRFNLPVNVVPPTFGYWIVDGNARVAARGSAVVYPALGATPAAAVAIAATPTGSGYWILASDGSVHAHGRARNVGQGVPAGTKATSLAVDPTSGGSAGFGYWILADDGRVGAFGAVDHGGIERTPDLRAVAIVATPDGRGYWILTSDGRVREFGSAVHFGDDRDTGEVAVAMAATRDGGGYWILSNRGAVSRFGNALHHGQDPRDGARAIAVTQDGDGYWILYASGEVQSFGSAFALPPVSSAAVGIAVDENYFFFRSMLNDLVVDVADASQAPGAPLIVYGQKRSGDLDNQLWTFVRPPPHASGFDFIASKQTGLVIDIQDTDPGSKAPIVVRPRKTSEADDQLWHLSPASEDFPTLHYVYIQNRLTREVIDIPALLPTPGTRLIASPQRRSGFINNQLWVVARYFGLYYADLPAKLVGAKREQVEVASASA